MTPKIDLTGKVFGGWTVLEETPKTKQGSSTWKCRCECGTIRDRIFYAALTTGRSSSCGCRRKGAKRSTSRPRSPTSHSQRSNITYQSWLHMKTRCFNLKHPSSKRYGQRGIGMTSAWRTSFPAFLSDMGERPSKDHRLERIDTEGHYTKDNCRWVRDD